MKRKCWVILLCAMLALLLTGCQLARDGADGRIEEDRLAGYFLTTEYLDLFDFEGYLEDNLQDLADSGETTIKGETTKYQGRLYAALTTKTVVIEETGETYDDEEYVFPIEGMRFFHARIPAAENRESYLTVMFDPAITDDNTAYVVNDEGESVTLTGTMYVSSSKAERKFYFNPVYQSADGRVYALSGDSFHVISEAYGEGPIYSQTMDAQSSVTVNGQTKKESVSVKLSINGMYAPEKIVVLQMDEENGVLSQVEYKADKMPEVITAEPKTAYLIIETYRHDGQGEIDLARAIYSRGAQSIETFYSREDGVCVKHWTRIEW